MGILGQHDGLVTLESGDIVSSAVQHMFVVHTEILAQSYSIVILNGQKQHTALDQRQEVGCTGIQSVLNRILVQCLNANDLVKLSNQIITFGCGIDSAIDIIQTPIIIIQSADQVTNHTQGICTVQGITDVTDTVYKILCGNRILSLCSGVIYPLQTLADLEGPYGIIVIVIPALSQRGHIQAVGIRLYQTIDTVGYDLSYGGVRGAEIVQ